VTLVVEKLVTLPPSSCLRPWALPVVTMKVRHVELSSTLGKPCQTSVNPEEPCTLYLSKPALVLDSWISLGSEGSWLLNIKGLVVTFGTLTNNRIVQPGVVLQVMGLVPRSKNIRRPALLRATWGMPSLDCCSRRLPAILVPRPVAVAVKPSAVPVLGHVLTLVPMACVAANVSAE
jgi:hypothetical protein